MKKITIIILSFLLVISVSGCDKKEESKKTESTMGTNTTTTTIVQPTSTTTSRTKESITTTTSKKTTTSTTATSKKTTTTTTAKESTTTTTQGCRAKKFSKKYTYVYNTKEECLDKAPGNFEDLYARDVIKDLSLYGCDEIIDECGNKYYGVHFLIWTGPGNDDYKTIYY